MSNNELITENSSDNVHESLASSGQEALFNLANANMTSSNFNISDNRTQVFANNIALPVLEINQSNETNDRSTVESNKAKISSNIAMKAYSVDSSPIQIFQNYHPAIVRIDAEKTERNKDTQGNQQDSSYGQNKIINRLTGAGFIVDSEGYVLTGFHTIKDASSIKIQTSDGKEYSAQIAAINHAKDQAVLKIMRDDPKQEFQTVKLAKENNFVKDNSLYAFGFPLNSQRAVLSELKYSDQTKLSKLSIYRQSDLSELDKIRSKQSPQNFDPQTGEDMNRTLIRVSGNIIPGMSGAPVFNQYSEVIGMTNFGEISGKAGYLNPLEDLYETMSMVPKLKTNFFSTVNDLRQPKDSHKFKLSLASQINHKFTENIYANSPFSFSRKPEISHLVLAQQNRYKS